MIMKDNNYINDMSLSRGADLTGVSRSGITYDDNNYDDDNNYNDDDDNDDDDEDDDDDDDYDDIIPNALLDQIDPDGAIERLPELFSDPQFWKDSVIWFFLGFLYLLNRFNNPMLNGIVDLDKVDFTQFYNLPPTP